MSDPVRYGQMKSERMAEENNVCRQIVREISNFGVSQRQQLLVIYLLALELEDNDMMATITSFIRELAGKDLFVSSMADEEVLSGPSNV